MAGVIGEAATSQSLTATVTLSATRDVTLGLESGVRATETADAATDFLVYTAGIRVNYRILQWLSVNGGYRYLRQETGQVPSIWTGMSSSSGSRPPPMSACTDFPVSSKSSPVSVVPSP